MKTLRKRRPVDELSGSEAVDAEQPVLWSTARHLDETITLQGFYCLHDCRWPGTRNGSIDHVVIGATGAWVIEDVHPNGPVTTTETSLRAGTFTLAPELRRLQDQATVVAGILGDVDVQPILSVHEAALPRHSFQVDDVRVAAALWPTSQVIARPSAFLGPLEVERLALVAIEALRPGDVAGPRLAPPGGPKVALPFVPVGSPVDSSGEPWAATDLDLGETGPGRRPHRLLRRAAVGVVVALMALGVVVELVGGNSSLLGEPAADEAPAIADETPGAGSPDI